MTEPLFLLDSNICIYILRDAGSAAAARLEQCRPGTAVTSAVSFAEVLRGIPAHELDALAKARAFFALVPVLPFDQAAAEMYREIPFKRGTFDRLIAAHALAMGVVLVTNNEADFADVPGLRLENWIKEG